MSGDLAAPLGAVTEARLNFVRGAANVTIDAEPAMPELFRAHFEHPLPTVRVHEGIVGIRYHDSPLGRRAASNITLSGSVSWDIECRRGASGITADLTAAQLGSVELTGGVSDVTLLLPRADGCVCFFGGATNVIVRYPTGVGVRVELSGSATDVRLDEQHFDALDHETIWHSADYDNAQHRYDIVISGGARSLTVVAR